MWLAMVPTQHDVIISIYLRLNKSLITTNYCTKFQPNWLEDIYDNYKYSLFLNLNALYLRNKVADIW